MIMKYKANNSPFRTLPRDWVLKKLGDIGTISSGTTPLRSKAEFHMGTIPWVKTTDLNNSIIKDTEEKITQLALQNTSLKLYPRGTVLVAMYGGFNQIGRTGILAIEATINQALSAIIVDQNKIDPNFLIAWLNGNVSHWKSYAGSSRKDPNITSRDVAHFPFPLIRIAEQTAIANLLSTWDRAIELNTQLIVQKELQKKWLMQQLLTGKKRLKGFSGKWEDTELSALLEYEQPTKYLVKDTLYNDSYSTPVLTAGKTFILGYTNEVDGICTDIPVLIFDDFTTALKYVDFPFKAKSSAMKLLRPKPNVNLKFVYESIQMINYVVGGHERHWISKFAYLTIPCPSLQEQTAIANLLQAADSEIQLLQTKKNNLAIQKKGLMQILLTGKKRLNTI